MFIVFISVARFFANFWTDQYFNLSHKKIGIACLLVTILVSCSSIASVALACNEGSICPFGRMHTCMDDVLKMFINICIVPVNFLNGAIIMDLFQLKQILCLKFVQNFKLSLPNLCNNAVTPAPLPLELPTISNSIDQYVAHGTPTHTTYPP